MQLDVSVRLHGERLRKRIAVLVSREPHCLQQLIADHAAGLHRRRLRLRAVEPRGAAARSPRRPASRSSGCRRPTRRRTWPSCSSACARTARTWWCSRATCRWSRRELVEQFRNRIINIHPSLLPYHPGANAYKQAFEEGCRVSGCTAHFVTEQLDQGPVVLQDVFHIRVGEDTLDDVRARGQELEGKVLSQAVQLFAADQLVVKDKKVIFRPGHITAS